MTKIKNDTLITISKYIDKGYGYLKIAEIFNIGTHTADTIKRIYELHGLDGLINRKK